MADTTATFSDHEPSLAPTVAPLTEDVFLADRQVFWSWFTGMIVKAVIFLVVLLLLLWFFLVR